MTPIVRNVAELNLAWGARAAARLTGTVILVDRLGLGGYGRLGWALTLTYLVLGEDFGLAAWATREAARDPGFFRRSAVAFLGLRLGLAALEFGLLASILPIACPDPAVRRLALGLGLSAFPLALSTAWMHFARDRTDVLRNATLVREAIWLAAIVLLVHRSAELGRLVPAAFLAELAEALWMLAAALRIEGRPALRSKLPSLRDALASAIPLWLVTRATHWRTQLGTLVVGAVYGPVAVGAYDLAWRVTFNAWSVGSLTVSATSPTLLRDATAAPDQFWALLGRTLRIALVLSLLFPLFVVPLARPALALIDPEIVAAAVPLAILACFVPPGILRAALRAALFALGRARAITSVALLDLVIATPIVLYAAHRFGPVGLATGVAGAEVLLLAAMATALGRRPRY